MYLSTIAITLIFGLAFAEDTITMSRVNAAQIPNVDWCTLRDVVCENEKPVEEAVEAVSNAIGHDVTDETRKRIAYLYEKATAAGVPFKDAVKTVYCESMWISQKSVLPEESYGLAQIHLPSHKNVTKEQAMDAYFAIDFLVEHWFTDQATADKMWFGYSRMTGMCTNGLIIDL